MTVRFFLPAVLRLAEHAVAAPIHLYHPGRSDGGRPSLTMFVISGTAFLLSGSLPDRVGESGEPRTVTAQLQTIDPDDVAGWSAPHLVVGHSRAASSSRGAVGELPAMHAWYLPLGEPAVHPAIDLMRNAVAAGYTHLRIDMADLSVAVMRPRRRTRTPVGR